MSPGRQPPDEIEYRLLDRDDLPRIGDIDRTERIETLYVQRGPELEEVTGDWSAPPWSADGVGEHSVSAQRKACEEYLDAGATALGAFVGPRLVGIGVVRPHLRAGVAQLAYLHVSAAERGLGVGRRLTAELERIAREAGDGSIVVSATPSENTVRFYRRGGYEPMAAPLPDLFALEPEDVHMEKQL